MSASEAEADKDADNAPLSVVTIAPALSHRIYPLIGFAWPAFGILFLILLCANDWFALPFSIAWLFPVVCFVALLLGHCLAMTLESTWMTNALYYFRRGMPLLFYRRFARVQTTAEAVEAQSSEHGQPAIIFGAKRVLLSAVDELYLTWLGMLEIRSYATSGKVLKTAAAAGAPLNKPDLLARVPIGVLTLGDQKRLVEIFKAGRPGLTINKRLEERLNSPVVKGQALIQSLGACVLLYALFDVSYATLTWLEMLKNYYGSQLTISHPDKAGSFLGSAGREKAQSVAVSLYDQAEHIRNNPSQLSWAYRALFKNGNSASELLAIRAKTLYYLGRREEAIKVLREALLLKPHGYKVQLQVARMLAQAGKRDQAREVLDQVLEKHKDVLMPRIYNYAMVANDDKAAGELYKKYLSQLDEVIFGDEPNWPPGDGKPLMEMWRRDDIEFLVPLLKPSGKN